MEYAILVDVDGLEQIVKRGAPYSWQLNCVVAEEYDTRPNHSTHKLVGRTNLTFPSIEECIAPVLAKLKAKEQEIQAEAYEELQKVKVRREELLALTYSPTTGEVSQ